MRANEGMGSLDRNDELQGPRSKGICTYCVKEPDHAPVADPGFTKKRPSYSIAWKLTKNVVYGQISKTTSKKRQNANV